MCNVVHSELILVAIFCQGSIGGHDTGIADEDVELRDFGDNYFCGFLDRGERQLVAFDERKLHRGGCGIGIIDYALSTLGVAASEIKVLGGVLGQTDDGLLAEPISP